MWPTSRAARGSSRRGGHPPSLGAVGRFKPQILQTQGQKGTKADTKQNRGAGRKSRAVASPLGGAQGRTRMPSCSANIPLYLDCLSLEGGLKGKAGGDVV